MGVRLQGTVRWFNGTKGYGFIRQDQGAKDVFVHASALREEGITALAEGQRVTFEVIQAVKGPQAVHVKFIRDVT